MFPTDRIQGDGEHNMICFLTSREKQNPQKGPALMDPSTLSIEEGKKILRQFGIPQREVSTCDIG